MRYWLLVLVSIFILPCLADDDGPQPPPIGNFYLPGSQQPGPLISFGQNILQQNQIQLFMLGDKYAGTQGYRAYDIQPSIIYGVTDCLSAMLSLPYAVNYKSGTDESKGFEDATVQLEYAYYNSSTTEYQNQFTIVGNITAPTGSVTKNPATGYGSPSVFIGGTFDHMSVDWYYFASPGVTLTTSNNGNKLGNNFLYQAGIGRNLKDSNGWLFAVVVEADGAYAQKDRIDGAINPNSGGNVVYLTPSLWASTKQFIFQIGAGYPVAQHLFGNQPRNTYLLAADVGWSIY